MRRVVVVNRRGRRNVIKSKTKIFTHIKKSRIKSFYFYHFVFSRH